MVPQKVNVLPNFNQICNYCNNLFLLTLIHHQTHFQVEEETLATIERDNRILLEKMSFVMRTRGRVDNRNDYEHKSLNKTKRQRELLRVTHENQVRKKLAIKTTFGSNRSRKFQNKGPYQFW